MFWILPSTQVLSYSDFPKLYMGHMFAPIAHMYPLYNALQLSNLSNTGNEMKVLLALRFRENKEHIIRK